MLVLTCRSVYSKDGKLQKAVLTFCPFFSKPMETIQSFLRFLVILCLRFPSYIQSKKNQTYCRVLLGSDWCSSSLCRNITESHQFLKHFAPQMFIHPESDNSLRHTVHTEGKSHIREAVISRASGCIATENSSWELASYARTFRNVG